MRLFLALWPPQEVVRAVVAVRDRLAAQDDGVAWVREQSVHLTLRFLGAVDDLRVDSLTSDVAKALELVPPINLRLDRLGGFPDLKRPRVIFVGLAGSTDHLVHIASNLADATRQYAAMADDKVLHPHLTLGRVKTQRALQLPENTPIPPLEWTADSVSLVRSHLGQNGSTYEDIAKFRLNT